MTAPSVFTLRRALAGVDAPDLQRLTAGRCVDLITKPIKTVKHQT